MFSSTYGDLLLTQFILMFKEAWVELNIDYWNSFSFLIQARWVALTNTLHTILLQLDAATFSNYIDTLFVYKLVLSNVLFMVLLIGFFVYLLNQGVQIISFFSNGLDTFSDTFATLSELDEEVGALDDAIMFGLVFLVIIAWFIFFTIFTTFYMNTLTWFVMILNFIFLTAVFTPLFVLYSFGGAFTTYVRGVGRTTSILMETFLDFVAVGVMIARFLIQNIRLLLIFTAFFELSEFIYMSCDFKGSFLASKFFSLSVQKGYIFANNYWYDWFGDFLIEQLLLIYYWGHLTLTFIVQLINYFCLSFYLFFFLYTTFVLDSSEKYFFYKRTL